MEENKTRPTGKDVATFINDLVDPMQRADSMALYEIMRDITGEDPVMWGDSIIGYGKYSYTYASGRSGEWFKAGFSPRKQNITIYLNYGFEEEKAIMDRLGKFKTGTACLYIRRLSDVDLSLLRRLIQKYSEKKYGA